jgi:hypothetical protein
VFAGGHQGVASAIRLIWNGIGLSHWGKEIDGLEMPSSARIVPARMLFRRTRPVANRPRSSLARPFAAPWAGQLVMFFLLGQGTWVGALRGRQWTQIASFLCAPAE